MCFMWTGRIILSEFRRAVAYRSWQDTLPKLRLPTRFMYFVNFGSHWDFMFWPSEIKLGHFSKVSFVLMIHREVSTKRLLDMANAQSPNAAVETQRISNF